MESLTKDNFWNELQEAFPEHMKQFLAWIDDYKKRKRWQDLFAPEIKFHHLPLEMQSGIVFLFFKEVFQINIVMMDITDTLEVVQTIKDVFAQKFMDDQIEALQKD